MKTCEGKKCLPEHKDSPHFTFTPEVNSYAESNQFPSHLSIVEYLVHPMDTTEATSSLKG
jgi:hypothetical protein